MSPRAQSPASRHLGASKAIAAWDATERGQGRRGVATQDQPAPPAQPATDLPRTAQEQKSTPQNQFTRVPAYVDLATHFRRPRVLTRDTDMTRQVGR